MRHRSHWHPCKRCIYKAYLGSKATHLSFNNSSTSSLCCLSLILSPTPHSAHSSPLISQHPLWLSSQRVLPWGCQVRGRNSSSLSHSLSLSVPGDAVSPFRPRPCSYHLSAGGRVLVGHSPLIWSQWITPVVWWLSLEEWLNASAWERMEGLFEGSVMGLAEERARLRSMRMNALTQFDGVM